MRVCTRALFCMHVYVHYIFSTKKNRTTNPKSNQIVGSVPPLATTRPAYITFIITRKAINHINQDSGRSSKLIMTKEYSWGRQWREAWDLLSQPDSVEMKRLQTNHHEESHIHHFVHCVPVMSPVKYIHKSVDSIKVNAKRIEIRNNRFKFL